jgi:outer membrane murein-binding lipoprotein Lpp
MKKFNSILQLLVALFFAISLVFFLSFDTLKGLFGLEELTSGTVVTILLVGLVLFSIVWGTTYLVYKNYETKISKIESEKDSLKAKLYDLDQIHKTLVAEKKTFQQEDEKESSVIRPRQNFKE